jgi:hypothetical protein
MVYNISFNFIAFKAGGLRVFENGVLIRKFEPDREKVAEGCRRMHK